MCVRVVLIGPPPRNESAGQAAGVDDMAAVEQSRPENGDKYRFMNINMCPAYELLADKEQRIDKLFLCINRQRERDNLLPLMCGW